MGSRAVTNQRRLASMLVMTHSLRVRPATRQAAASRRASRRAVPQAADVRREQILDRALALVNAGGLRHLTMKRIADRLGVSEAAIYRHVPTRRALIFGLMDRLEAMLLVPIRAIAADATRTQEERLEAVLRHHIAIVLEHHSLPILLLAEASASGDAKLLGRMRGIFSGYVEILGELLRSSGVDGPGGTEPDPGALALLFLGVPTALAIQHRLDPDVAGGRAAANVLVPLVVDYLTGLQKSSGSSRRQERTDS
jgi:AcrR family transcriptional regulator